ncbi:MAG: adenylate kinase [Candidatus Gastranaerophilales bacterium]|nr:adenylate kinase [Candidatus Gastranaerophilales bacterium]
MTTGYIFIGAPGCGKGTQTELLAKELGIPHIDTGSLLRKNIEEKTEAGLIAKEYIDKGQLVPIDVVSTVIKNRLNNADCNTGYVLDGYPRSLEQALALDKILLELKMDTNLQVFYFDIPNEVLIERLINRRSCSKCGKIYNLKTFPPKNKEVCDVCGGKLIQRKDDTKETALLRFQTYETQTKPLIEFYSNRGNLKTINANQSINEVWSNLNKLIGAKA